MFMTGTLTSSGKKSLKMFAIPRLNKKDPIKFGVSTPTEEQKE